MHKVTKSGILINADERKRENFDTYVPSKLGDFTTLPLQSKQNEGAVINNYGREFNSVIDIEDLDFDSLHVDDNPVDSDNFVTFEQPMMDQWINLEVSAPQEENNFHAKDISRNKDAGSNIN